MDKASVKGSRFTGGLTSRLPIKGTRSGKPDGTATFDFLTQELNEPIDNAGCHTSFVDSGCRCMFIGSTM
jgi:hypothetical protein